MVVEFSYIKRLNSKVLEEELIHLLFVCDGDFTPSLSSSRFGVTVYDKLKEYVREKKETHEFIFVYKENSLIGFMNFKHNYKNNESVFAHLENHSIFHPKLTLIDTLCFLPEYRGKGMAQKLYLYFESLSFGENHPNYIIRSASKSHLIQNHLFIKQGYKFLYEAPFYRDEKEIKNYYYKKAKECSN